jgi:lysophospholipase L1-like esterase
MQASASLVRLRYIVLGAVALAACGGKLLPDDGWNEAPSNGDPFGGIDATVDGTAPPADPPACPLDGGPALGDPPYFYSDASPFVFINYGAWGDSITAGATLGTTPSGQPGLAYPALASQRMGSNVQVTNHGKPGWTSGQILDAAVGDQGELLATRQPGALHIATLLAGDNDFHYDAGADEIEANIHAWVVAARAAGWLTVVCTVPPGNFHPAWDAWQRGAMNDWMRAGGSGADAVCELDDPRMLDLEEFGGVHPNINGHSWMADRLMRAMAPVLIRAGAR